jgi:hypothetical protein
MYHPVTQCMVPMCYTLNTCANGEVIESHYSQNVLFHAAAMLLFSAVHRISVTSLCSFLCKIYCHKTFQNHTLSGASVASASQIPTPVVFLQDGSARCDALHQSSQRKTVTYSRLQKYELCVWGSLWCHNVHTTFHQNMSSGSQAGNMRADRQTRADQLFCVHFLKNVGKYA